jgi:RNA polymerase sigma-70 factor, ECF subfamily
VFIRVYERIQSFDTSLSFSPWIYRVAHNIFVNELKRKSRFEYNLFDPDTFFPQVAAQETADEAALAAELTAAMEYLLQELPLKYREVLILFYYESLSYQEISDVLKIPVTTVGVRMSRARQKITELYNQKQV